MYHPWLIFATLVANAPPPAPPPPPSYISERLSVSLHGANAPDAPVVKQILGGAPVKVLSHEGALLKIRTEDGSVGWIEPELVTTDTPKLVQYQELTERFAKAQEALKALQDKPAASGAASTRDDSKIVTELRGEVKNTLEHVVELEKHIRDNSTQVFEANGRIRALEEENLTLKGQLAAKPSAAVVAPPREAGNVVPASTAPVSEKSSISLLWFFVSLGLALVLPSALVWFVMHRRLKKKLSGFRARL